MLTTKDGGVPGATTPTNGDGLTTPHSQPAKITTKSTRILGVIHGFIRRAASGFTLGRCMDAYNIMMLILVAVMLIQGVLQWLR